MTPKMKEKAATTRAFAAKRRPRWGTATTEERIWPEAYSPVTTSAPRTATTIMPRVEPEEIMSLATSARSGEPA